MSSVSGPPVFDLFSPSRERRRLLLLVVGSALIFAAGIGMRALWNPNEPVYAEGVREMTVRGDYFLPYVNGKIYSDKPILYFWAQILSLRLFGESEAAVRLPGLMFGLLGAATTGLLAWRLFERRDIRVVGEGSFGLPVPSLRKKS